MSYADFYIARKQCQAARDLVIMCKGGWQDQETLKRLQEIIEAAAAAVDDRDCRALIAAIADYAFDLFSETAHQKWARGSTSGTDFLRLQILHELDAFKRRLSEIEKLRTSVASEDDPDVIPGGA